MPKKILSAKQLLTFGEMVLFGRNKSLKKEKTMGLHFGYDYITAGGATPKNWGGLSSSLHTNLPVASTSKPAIAPPDHELSPLSISPSEFFWEAMTVGYGEAADYGIYWLIKGVKVGTKQIEELRRLAMARITTLSRGYEFVAASGTMPFHLRQRDVYDLIEQSEKNNISFYLGCAMSSICAPVAMASRQPPVPIGYLFHARLLGSAQKTTKTTIVHPSGGRLIDFLAFDQNLGAHIIEAKGSGGAFPYGQLADAIDQCCSVTHVQLSGIPSQQPASLNAAIAFYGKTQVACGANPVGACVRTAVVHVKKRGPTVAPVTTSTPNSLHMLIGLQAVGVYLSLLPAAQTPIANAWTQFNFKFDNGIGTGPVVAVETELFKAMLIKVHRCRFSNVIRR